MSNRTYTCNQDSSFLVGQVNGQTPEIVTPVAVTPDIEATESRRMSATSYLHSRRDERSPVNWTGRRAGSYDHSMVTHVERRLYSIRCRGVSLW